MQWPEGKKSSDAKLDRKNQAKTLQATLTLGFVPNILRSFGSSKWEKKER